MNVNVTEEPTWGYRPSAGDFFTLKNGDWPWEGPFIADNDGGYVLLGKDCEDRSPGARFNDLSGSNIEYRQWYGTLEVTP
jgi:hypothetical protein